MSHIIWTFDMECSHVNRPTVMFLQLFLFILNQTFEITCFTVVLFHSIECEEFSLLVYLKGQLYVYVIVYLLLLRPLHQQQLSNVSNLWLFTLSLQRLQSLAILYISPTSPIFGYSLYLSNVSNLWPFSLSLQRLQSLAILSISPACTPLSLCLPWGRAFRN